MGCSCEMTRKVVVTSCHGRGLALILQWLSDVFQQRSNASFGNNRVYKGLGTKAMYEKGKAVGHL